MVSGVVHWSTMTIAVSVTVRSNTRMIAALGAVHLNTLQIGG